MRRGKRGRIPADLAPILERLQLVEETWLDTLMEFGRTFRTAAGRIVSLIAEAARRSRHWLHGMSHIRHQFA